jgi:hypothetical protein
MNEIIDKINKTDSAIKAGSLRSELRILDWMFYYTVVTKYKRLKVYGITRG